MPTPRASIPRGVARLAIGHADGLAHFPATVRGFLLSLLPLVGLPLIATVLMLQSGGGLAAIADLLATVVVVLAAPVLSYELARLWRREDYWLRFATAFNWCQWLLPLLASALLIVLRGLMNAGLAPNAARGLLLMALGGYGLWLHWFLARNGLGLSPARAALLVVGVNLGTALLVLGPTLLVLQPS